MKVTQFYSNVGKSTAGLKTQTGHFVKDGKPLLDAPIWGMTLLNAGSMRFRWSEDNRRRDEFFASLCGENRQVAPLELIHSKTVLLVDSCRELYLKKADGVLTKNENLIPTVTVADCMPIFVYDTVSHFFGVLHSGWRGTGIIAEAYSLLHESCGARAEDLCVVLGAHIRNCCYHVDKERARYFAESFGDQCVRQTDSGWALSLEEANLALLDKIGVPRDNVFCVGECTACFSESGHFKYGSFRRETAAMAHDSPLEARQKAFTAQAAFAMVP